MKQIAIALYFVMAASTLVTNDVVNSINILRGKIGIERIEKMELLDGLAKFTLKEKDCLYKKKCAADVEELIRRIGKVAIIDPKKVVVISVERGSVDVIVQSLLFNPLIGPILASEDCNFYGIAENEKTLVFVFAALKKGDDA
jgi:hypothetical protein